MWWSPVPRPGGDEDRHLLVQYEAERASQGIGVRLHQGNHPRRRRQPMPADVENVSLAAGNQTITVSADNISCVRQLQDLCRRRPCRLSDVRTADTSLRDRGLDNYKRYYVGFPA